MCADSIDMINKIVVTISMQKEMDLLAIRHMTRLMQKLLMECKLENAVACYMVLLKMQKEEKEI